MTLEQLALLMIAPAGALVIAGVVFWWTSDKPRHHPRPGE